MRIVLTAVITAVEKSKLLYSVPLNEKALE